MHNFVHILPSFRLSLATFCLFLTSFKASFNFFYTVANQFASKNFVEYMCDEDQTVARNILDVRYGQRRRYILTYMVNNKTDFYETLLFEKNRRFKNVGSR